MNDPAYSHLVYWTIPQLGADGAVASERHYAVNLSEIDPLDAEAIEMMLDSYRVPFAGSVSDRRLMRTDPRIKQFRHLFRPFIEVKNRAQGLCRCSSVWLPYVYAEYADGQAIGEPQDKPLPHPAVKRLADSA